ncbi:MAG: helix-turn-helix domain-containing protein [Thermoleophilia bacterium]
MTTHRHAPFDGALLTIAEAAEHLGVSRRTLERRIAAGALAVFRDGSVVRIAGVELRRYVAAHTARRPTAGDPSSAPRTLPRRLWD